MLIRRAGEDDIRAALDIANIQFKGNLQFKELEDRSGPRVPRFKVRLAVRNLDGPGCRRGFLSYVYGLADKPRRIRSACYHAYDSRRSEPGFPDLVLVHEKRHKLIFADLKRMGNKATHAQDRWPKALSIVARLAPGVIEVHLWKPCDWDQIAEMLCRRRRAA